MLKTRITEMLGIQYPIIQGAMVWLSVAELTAAVSNAGGLGILASMNFDNKNELREEVRKTKRLTNKPFGVNINLFPTVRPADNEAYIETLAEEGVGIVETSGRSPESLMKLLKEAKMKVIHKIASVRHAQKAEQIGVDAVTLVGYECGGVPGMDDVTTMVLIPKAADSLKIPVIAGGGIGDARGLVAALALGAEAVTMGTRFVATKECWAHPNIKEWIVKANEADTMVVMRSLNEPRRVMKTATAQKVPEMEARSATLQELLTVVSGQLGKAMLTTGDLNAGILACGQVIGLIDEILSVKEVISGMVNGARVIYERLGAEGVLRACKRPL